MDLKVPIIITDEVGDDTITAQGTLNLASGEIAQIRYDEHDPEADGFPWEHDDYDFSSGSLSNNGKTVEFSIVVSKSGDYSVSPDELGEIKLRAAALFAAAPNAPVNPELAHRMNTTGLSEALGMKTPVAKKRRKT